jgi:hypothetical protein
MKYTPEARDDVAPFRWSSRRRVASSAIHRTQPSSVHEEQKVTTTTGAHLKAQARRVV